MDERKTGVNTARMICASMLAVLLSGVHAAATGALLLEGMRFTATSVGLDWSPQELLDAAGTALIIGWFAVMVPAFMAVLFQSLLVSVAWHALRRGSLTEGILEATRRLTAHHNGRER